MTRHLSTRLTFLLSGVTLTTLALCFGVTYVLVRAEELRDLDSTLRAEATATALGLDDAPAALLQPGLFRLPDSLQNVDHHVAIYDPSGTILATTPNLQHRAPRLRSFGLPRPLPPQGAFFDLDLGPERLRAVVLRHPQAGAGFLLFAGTREPAEDDAHFLLKVFGVLSALALLTTITAARLFGQRLAADVERLALVARRVGEGELSARVGAAELWSIELTALGRDVDAMIHRLSESLTAQRTFVAHAAHELRSPLTALRGELQLSLRRPRSSEEYAATLVRLNQDVEGLVALAEDLLALARSRAGTAATVAPLEPAVREAWRTLEIRAKSRNVTLSVEPERLGPELSVALRSSELTRVLRNLFENAVTYSPAGGLIRLTVRTRDDVVELQVDDSGPGIPEQELPHVFSPLFRGSAAQLLDANGAGLGLAIVATLVEEAGGEVHAGAAQGGGASLTVRLPRTPRSKPTGQPPAARPSVHGDE